MEPEELTSPTEAVAAGLAGPKSRGQHTAETLAALWARLLPKQIHDIILPTPITQQLNPGEEILLVVYQAWYRNAGMFLLYNFATVILLLCFFLSAAIGYWRFDFGLFENPSWWMLAPFVLLVLWGIYAVYENLNYLKWRLVVTNNRLIFATPQRDAWYLADSIELNGKPRVIDSNWSDNNLLRFMQMLTGSRDVFISLQGLQFVQGTARVQDALVLPDVENAKIEKLKRIIFT